MECGILRCYCGRLCKKNNLQRKHIVAFAFNLVMRVKAKHYQLLGETMTLNRKLFQ